MPPLATIAFRDGVTAARWLRALAGVSAYLALAAFPILVLLLGDVPRGGGFCWDFAMALDARVILHDPGAF